MKLDSRRKRVYFYTNRATSTCWASSSICVTMKVRLVMLLPKSSNYPVFTPRGKGIRVSVCLGSWTIEFTL